MREPQRKVMTVEEFLSRAVFELIERKPVGRGKKRLVGNGRVVGYAGPKFPNRAANFSGGRTEEIAIVGDSGLCADDEVFPLLLIRNGSVDRPSRRGRDESAKQKGTERIHDKGGGKLPQTVGVRLG